MNTKPVWNPDIISGSITLGKNIDVWNKTNGKCCYCGKQTLKLYRNRKENRSNPLRATIEHIKPKSRGGTYALKNLTIACSECNGLRGNKTLKTFRKHFGREFSYVGLVVGKITHCPVCKDVELAMSIQPMKNDKGEIRLRPLKKPFLCCALVACRRIVNTETGDVWNDGKLEIRG